MLEDSIGQSMFYQQQEKTFLDKLLAKDDIAKIGEIIAKTNLTRKDILQILYLISATEAKLWNLGEWDRYVILKFFVWIREFVKIAELLYDYQDDLKEKEAKGITTLTPRTRKLLNNNERLIEHNAKFLIDLYINICRTTLSLGGTAFLEALKNKYEIAYSGQNPNTPIQQDKSQVITLKR